MGAASYPTLAPLQVSRQPWTLRAFPLLAVALDRSSTEGKPVTATGVAVAVSHRWSRNNYYLWFEPLVQLAFRNGNDPAIPDGTMGIGAPLDLSGTLGLGVS